MSDSHDETEPALIEGEAPAKVGGKKKLIIIIVAALLLLLGIGAGLYFAGIVGGHKKAEEGETGEAPAEGAKDEHGEAKGPPGQPVFYELPEFIVNLNSGTGKNVSFLKMKVAIELEKAEDVAKVEALMPRVTDSFNTYLRELRASDLSGSAGMVRLKEELLLRLNKSLDGIPVRNVYIKQILVQ